MSPNENQTFSVPPVRTLEKSPASGQLALEGCRANETQTKVNVITRWTLSFVQQPDLQTELAFRSFYVQPL